MFITLGNETLKKTGAIGYFMRHFPEVKEEQILNELNAFLANKIDYKVKLTNEIKEVNREYIKEKLEVLIKSISRHLELPGDKRHLMDQLEKFKNEMRVA